MPRRPIVLAFGALTVGLFTSPARAAAPTAQARQLELAAHPAVKLRVRQAGWLRVTQPQLVAAGLDPKVVVSTLQLFSDGVEQPLQLTGNGDDVLDAGEALEFYAEGRDDLWTDTRTYWLVSGAAGLRVPLVKYPNGQAPPALFRATREERGHGAYYASLLNGDESNFFTSYIGTTAFTQTVATPHPAAPAQATLRLFLQGATTGDHVLPVAVNGTSVGTCTYPGQEPYVCELPLPALVDGDNDVTLSSQGAAPDFSLLSAVSIEYDHPYLADDDALRLTAPPGTHLALDGFSRADVRVVDLSAPGAPVELLVQASASGAGFSASVDTPTDTMDHALYAFTGAGVGAPLEIAASRPSTASAPQDGGSELVILSPSAFLAAVQPLAERRRQEGWSVALVDLQDVYDELGGGDKTVFAIRDFLHLAHDQWRTPPRFVLFVGDASFDPRNFLGQGDFDLAPTKLIDTQEMETASDDWFVDWNDDGVPELAVGRLSVRTSDEATRVVNKILSYAGTDDLPRGGLFVADQNDDGLDFEQASNLSAATVSALMPVDRFFRGQAASTQAGLLAKLNAGPFLVNYFGHGSVEVWDGSLADADAQALTNQHLSIYVSMNCLNGFFQDIYSESLAETLQKAPTGGAVAVWASSTLTSFDDQAALNREFLKRLTRTSLGEAAMAAKAAGQDLDTRRTWILFGDPTLFGKPSPPPGDAGAADGAADAGGPDGPRRGRPPTGARRTARASTPPAASTPSPTRATTRARTSPPRPPPAAAAAARSRPTPRRRSFPSRSSRRCSWPPRSAGALDPRDRVALPRSVLVLFGRDAAPTPARLRRADPPRRAVGISPRGVPTDRAAPERAARRTAGAPRRGRRAGSSDEERERPRLDGPLERQRDCAPGPPRQGDRHLHRVDAGRRGHRQLDPRRRAPDVLDGRPHERALRRAGLDGERREAPLLDPRHPRERGTPATPRGRGALRGRRRAPRPREDARSDAGPRGRGRASGRRQTHPVGAGLQDSQTRQGEGSPDGDEHRRGSLQRMDPRRTAVRQLRAPRQADQLPLGRRHQGMDRGRSVDGGR